MSVLMLADVGRADPSAGDDEGFKVSHVIEDATRAQPNEHRSGAVAPPARECSRGDTQEVSRLVHREELREFGCPKHLDGPVSLAA